MIRISRNGIRIRIGRSRGKGGRIGVAAFQHPAVVRVVDQFLRYLACGLVVRTVAEVYPDFGNTPFERYIDVFVCVRTVVQHRYRRFSVHQQRRLYRIGIQRFGDDGRFQFGEAFRTAGGRPSVRYDIYRIPGVQGKIFLHFRQSVPDEAGRRSNTLVVDASLFAFLVDKDVQCRHLIFVQFVRTGFRRFGELLHRQHDLEHQAAVVSDRVTPVLLARRGEKQDSQREDR